VFTAPVCGDGVCDSPLETATFERFGCEADCGRMATTQVTVVVEVDVTRPADYTVPVSYNVCHRSELEHRNATFLNTVSLCVWAEPRVVPKPLALKRTTLRCGRLPFPRNLPSHTNSTLSSGRRLGQRARKRPAGVPGSAWQHFTGCRHCPYLPTH